MKKKQQYSGRRFWEMAKTKKSIGRASTEVNLIERDRGERPQSGHSGEEIGESVHKMNILERDSVREGAHRSEHKRGCPPK